MMIPVRVHAGMGKELDVAMSASDKAANIIQSFKKHNTSLDVSFKGKNDLLTKADLASEEAIKSELLDSFPNDLIIAEESVKEKMLTDKRTWIIDPIDGTTNFVHGFPTYCISIALYENKQPLVALVHEVSRGEMFTAIAGKGAQLNGRPISVSDISDPSQALLGTGFPYRDLSVIDSYIDLTRFYMQETQGIRRPGSAAYDLCCVAAGRFDGFYEYALEPWDVAAGALIIREAGGVVTDWSGGDNWLFGRRIIAGNKTIHTYLKDTITKFIPSNLHQA